MENVQRISLEELRMKSHTWKKAVIVFDNKSWKRDFSLESRSYEISNDNKYFLPFANGNSLFGSALDGSDDGVRLDHYLHDWIIEYCYVVE